MCRTRFTAILTMCLAAALVGCSRSSTTTAVDEKGSTTTTTRTERQATYGYAAGEESEAKEKRTWFNRDERNRQAKAQTKVEKGMLHSTMAFPTGDRDSSVLLVSKQMPQQVRAGGKFEYKLTVKNISDQPLEGVVVYDRVPSEMTMRVSEADHARITTTKTTTERFAVRKYDRTNSPFLPRYTETPEARELTEGEAYAVETQGRRTEEGETNLGPASENEIAAQPDAPADAARFEVTRKDGANREANRQAARKDVVIVTKEVEVESTDVHATHREHTITAEDSFLAGEWYVGHLMPGESRTLTLTGTAPRGGTLATCTTAAYQPTLCLVSDIVEPMIKIERIAQARADACEEIKITYRLTNTGTGTAEKIVITEELPQGQFRSEDKQRAVRLDVDNLPEGETREVIVTTRFEQRGTYTGSALATDAYGVETRSAESTIQVVAPELAIDVQAPEQAYTSRPINYTVKVTNKGDGPAKQLVVRQSLPEGCECLNASHNGQVEGDQVIWKLPPLEPGQSHDLKVSIQSAGEGQKNATFTADAFCAKPVSDSAQTNLLSVGSLLLEVVDTNDPVPLNSNESYRIRVTNQGDKDDTNITFVVTLPDELDYADSKASVQPNINGKTITFIIPRLEPKATQTIEVSAKALRAGDVRFKVEMTSDSLTSPVMETEATKLY